MNALSFLSRAPKKVALVVAAAVMAVSTVVGPIANVAAQTNNVRIESTTRVANVTAGDTTYKESVDAKVDEVVKIEVWYHNMENFDSGKVANDLAVALNIPSAQGKTQTITGTVKGSNTNTVADTAQVNLSLDNAYLEYVEGSAKWRHNKGATDGRTECQTGNQEVPANDPNNCYVTETISDNVVKNSTGVVLENLQPCFAYEATVTVLARVKASEIKVNKYVSKHDGDQNVSNNKWELKNTAVPGDKLDYMIRFENKGNTTLKNVIVGDNLPDYLSYVPGTTRIYTTNHPSGIAAESDNVYKGGINVGNYAPGSTGYVVFTAVVDSKNKFATCGVYTLKNVGVVRPEGMNEFYNTAWTDVRVECKPGEAPKECKPGIPVNDDRCKETPAATPTTPATPKSPETPAVLPSTGPAALIGGLFGSSALGLGISSYVRSRRALRDALNR